MEETNAITSPVKAIRAYCLGCCWGSAEEVKLCPATDCELYPFRFGKNPFSTRTLTEKQRQANAERLRIAREKKAERLKTGNSSSDNQKLLN